MTNNDTGFPSPWIPAVRDDTYLFQDGIDDDRVIVGSCDWLEASLYVGEFIDVPVGVLVEVEQ